MDTLPPVVAPLPREKRFNRNLSPQSAFTWLEAGVKDFLDGWQSSVLYGLGVFIVSWLIVFALFQTGRGATVTSALAGFMIVGPALAIGLYQKSRLRQNGESVTLGKMVFVRPKSGRQLLLAGVLLCLLFAAWIRVAVLLYALLFGMHPFPGTDQIVPMLFASYSGLALLAVGTLVGALFATLSFALSVFSVPMLLDRRVDALTAMGTSVALVWHNRVALITWGAIVLAGFLLSLATGLLALIVVFPIIGHATWHAYLAIQE